MTQILMVRHGQSEWNAQGRWQGQADPPLSSLGLAQAEAAGRFLASQIPFDAIATSTLDRAATTGSIIAEHLGFGEPLRCPDLVERNVGEWSGLTRGEVDAKYPGFIRRRQYPPGYENDADFMGRIRSGIEHVVRSLEGDRLLVVAHGGLIYLLETSLGLAFQHIGNLGARWLNVDGDFNVTLGHRQDLLADFEGEHSTPTAI